MTTDPQRILEDLLIEDSTRRLGGDQFFPKPGRPPYLDNWRLTRCPSQGCWEMGIECPTGVPWGDTMVTESATGWCPKHGWYECDHMGDVCFAGRPQGVNNPVNKNTYP